MILSGFWISCADRDFLGWQEFFTLFLNAEHEYHSQYLLDDIVWDLLCNKFVILFYTIVSTNHRLLKWNPTLSLHKLFQKWCALWWLFFKKILHGVKQKKSSATRTSCYGLLDFGECPHTRWNFDSISEVLKFRKRKLMFCCFFEQMVELKWLIKKT